MYKENPAGLTITSTKHTFDRSLITKASEILANGQPPKEIAGYPPLACPKCDRLRKPQRVNKDGSVTYSCPPDHQHHGNRYTWRIAEDGTLID